jgi:hypothetical protein
LEKERYWIGYDKEYGMESDKAQLERKRKEKRREREKYWIGYEREYGRQKK